VPAFGYHFFASEKQHVSDASSGCVSHQAAVLTLVTPRSLVLVTQLVAGIGVEIIGG